MLKYLRDRYLLYQSIQHWKRMRRNAKKASFVDMVLWDKTERPNMIGCPLCQEYYIANCEDCPIRNYTGFPGCYYTPYGCAFNHFRDHNAEAFIEHATQEIAFLRRLLWKLPI